MKKTTKETIKTLIPSSYPQEHGHTFYEVSYSKKSGWNCNCWGLKQYQGRYKSGKNIGKLKFRDIQCDHIQLAKLQNKSL